MDITSQALQEEKTIQESADSQEAEKEPEKEPEDLPEHSGGKDEISEKVHEPRTIRIPRGSMRMSHIRRKNIRKRIIQKKIIRTKITRTKITRTGINTRKRTGSRMWSRMVKNMTSPLTRRHTTIRSMKSRNLWMMMRSWELTRCGLCGAVCQRYRLQYHR